MSCFLQLSSRHDGIPSTQLVLFRAVFQGTLVVVTMGIFDPKLLSRPFGDSVAVQKLVVARGIVGGTGFLLYYYTMTVLPLGDAITLLSLSPIITVLGGRVFLDEAVTCIQILASVSCVVGSFLMARPSILFGDNNASEDSQNAAATYYSSTGYVSGLLGSCCASAVLILIRKTGKKGVHVLQLLFSWCFFGFLFSTTIGMLRIGDSFVAIRSLSSVRSWGYVLGVCFFGSVAHLLMNYSARYAPAGLASITRSATIVWSYIFEILVFDEYPRRMTLLGVGLIVSSLLGIAVEKQRKQQQEQDDLQKHNNSSNEHDDELEIETTGLLCATTSNDTENVDGLYG